MSRERGYPNRTVLIQAESPEWGSSDKHFLIRLRFDLALFSLRERGCERLGMTMVPDWYDKSIKVRLRDFGGILSIGVMGRDWAVLM